MRRSINLDDEEAQYRWPIGNTNLMDVIVAVDECTQNAVRGL